MGRSSGQDASIVFRQGDICLYVTIPGTAYADTHSKISENGKWERIGQKRRKERDRQSLRSVVYEGTPIRNQSEGNGLVDYS